MIKLLNKLFGWFGYTLVKIVPPEPPKDMTEIEQLTKEFCDQVAEKFPDTSGLYKRETVLRMLQNRFPTEPKRNLALSIELYVQGK